VGDLKSDLLLIGRFISDEFIRIDYKNKEPGVFQWGVCILRFMSRGKKLNAKFIGYGPESQKLVFGDIFLEAVENHFSKK
ncbi:hypothetical protein MHK_003884, partial [Candidatus Magnetomorum sp. HK-1]